MMSTSKPKHIHLYTTRKRTKPAMMSTSKPKHIPPRIKREDFQAGHMKPNSYSLEDISAAIIDHLSRSKDEFTVKQLEGLAKFKYHGTWSSTDPDNSDDLRKVFDIFNAVFFNGILTGYCTLSFFPGNRGGYYKRCAAYCQNRVFGGESDPRFRFDKPQTHIGISRLDSKFGTRAALHGEFKSIKTP